MKNFTLICTGCFLIINTVMISQNTSPKKFNLNFDEYDSVKELPKGWFKWGTQPIKTEMIDKSNYIGKVTGNKKKEFGCIVYSMPAGFKGDTIELSGYMKIENVEKKGFSGLLLRLNNNDEKQSLRFDNMSNRKINGTRDWAKYSVKLPYSNKTDRIYVAGILLGKGTAWFDNFEVTIDGKNIQELKVIKKPHLDENNTATILQSLEKSSKPVDFTSEETLNQSLQPLIETIRDRKIISIGEDTHGTSEYYKLREAITKKLILEKGYNTVILESPYDDIELLTKNLKTGSIEKLMREHLFSIYQTEEMKSFIEWFKTLDNNNKVKFKGCDDSYWVLDQLLEKEFSQINDESFKKLYAKLKNTLTASSKSKSKNEYKRSLAVYESIVAIDQYLVANKLHTKHSKELLFNGKNSYINYKHISEGKSIQTRDEIMADRISYFAQDPEAKIIVWAHNAHISNTVIIDGEIGIMGHDLKQEFGNDYCSIGLSSLSGSYSYMTNKLINTDHKFDDVLEKGTLELQPSFSWEKTFNQFSDKPFYSDFSLMKNNLDEDNILGDLKLIGYNKESKEDYYKLTPITMFDFLIFVNNTNATTPLTEK